MSLTFKGKLCLSFSLFFVHFLTASGLHPEVLLNFEQRAKLNGYPVELHQVITEDDYIITLYRIPHGLKNQEDELKNKSAILIVHGMGGSAHNFIFLGAKTAPAFYFADSGFDVWMICARGVDCQNPKKHKIYDWNRDAKYWEYSMHEIGIYDVAASIDHILNVTDQKKIFTIGHSAGSPELLILTTERPEYNDKIKIITHYGGASTIKNFDYPLLQFCSIILGRLKNFLKMIGLHEIPTPSVQRIILLLSRQLCTDPLTKKICYAISPRLFSSTVTALTDDKALDLMFSMIPRLSVQQIHHYSNNLNNYEGDFRKYDWGPKKNMKLYGDKVPPLYNLSACTCANAFFYGATDSLSTPEDNKLVMDFLPNTIFGHEIGPRFSHVDFIFAKNSSHMVYEPTVKLFKDFDAGKISGKMAGKRKL